MNEEDFIFDNDDNIVLTKDNIILEKSKDLSSKDQLKKFKDLDGSWKLKIYDDTDFIIPNVNEEPICSDKIYTIFSDLQNRSVILDMFQKLTLFDLNEYLQNIKSNKHDYNWSDYEEYKLYGMKKPNLDHWVSFFVINLHYLYNYIYEEYNINVGTPDEFANFCFKISNTEQLPKF